MLAIVAAMGASVVAYQNPGLAFSNMVVSDGFAAFFRVVAYVVGIFTVLCSMAYLERENAHTGEFYILLLFSLAGQGIMASANELMMVFIGLEVSSSTPEELAARVKVEAAKWSKAMTDAGIEPE